MKKKTIKECPQCGRVIETLTDQEELLVREDKLEVITERGDKPCGRCEEGVENREEIL